MSVRADHPSSGYGGEGTIYDTILREQELFKAKLVDFISYCSVLKMWLQLQVPRIEDGNNFGVSVQEDVIGELTRSEDSCLIALDALTKFLIHRSKLVNKVRSHPLLQDS